MKLFIRSMRYIYTLFHYLAIPGILTRLLWRSRHISGYRHRWNERFGYIKRIDQQKRSIWVHAVSVGEVNAAVPLIKKLFDYYPNHFIVVTTSTPTGSAQVIKHLGNSIFHVYAPYDIPTFVNRFLRRTNTQYCIIMETEMWPNMLHCCKKRQIPILLANGRMSERSYLRYKIIPQLTLSMLQSYSMVAAQGLLDGERLLSFGLDPKRLIISGNIKFDLILDENYIQQGKKFRENSGTMNRPTLIAASTHEGEEEIILEAFKRILSALPQALLILVPRHPDRFPKVKKLCERQVFKMILRSDHDYASRETQLILGDTMGELVLLYSASDVAFVGGSLVAKGGHNLLEPAALGLPVLTGPHLQNFNEIGKLLQKAGAAQIVYSAKNLATAVIALFEAKELRHKMGMRAKEVISANKGALEKHLEWILKIF